MGTSDLSVIFLGVCERAASVREGKTNLFKWNVIGLKNVILSYIYPLKLGNLAIGLAIDYSKVSDELDLRIIEKDGDEAGFIKFKIAKEEESDTKSETSKNHELPIIALKDSWATAFVYMGETNIIISHPGVYHLCLAQQDKLAIIGQLNFGIINPPPLTKERIAAIKSDPTAIKAVRMSLACKKCSSGIKFYAALQPSETLEKEGYIQYDTVPDEFICDCDKTHIDLRLIRKNLHGFLGKRIWKSDNLDFIPMYEKSVLEAVREKYISLINSEPEEELLQKFIQENPILLNQFPAEKIFFKPPLLAKYFADFGIVTPQKELIFIEIEKAHTRLMKKNGDSASDLNHSFDQIRNWLHIADEHRLAVLDNIGIKKDEVSSVRGVVIAGRDSGYDEKHIRKLKGAYRGKISFLTYDDLLFALDILIRDMQAI